jgi:predicted metallo-beta-lactamase superfamily hydrolase
MRVLSGDVEETTDTEDERLYKQKRLMQKSPSKIIAPQSMMNQATKLLSDEFDKQYDAYKAKGKPHA